MELDEKMAQLEINIKRYAISIKVKPEFTLTFVDYKRRRSHGKQYGNRHLNNCPFSLQRRLGLSCCPTLIF
jgi:hypothetical protein